MHKPMTCLAAGVLLGVAGTAAAESPHSVSANVALATDYVFRGFSQTNEDPAIQGGFDYGHASGFYAGVWASNVKFNENAALPPAQAVDEANIEVDLYAGYVHEFAQGVSAEVGGIYYAYPGATSGLDYDFVEVVAGVSKSFEDVALSPSVGLKGYYSPEFFGKTGKSWYWNGAVDVSLPYEIGGVVTLGYSDIQDGARYWDWKVGVSRAVYGPVAVDLAYYGTDVNGDPLADDRIVLGISASF